MSVEIVYASGDLMFPTQLRQLAERYDVAMRWGPTFESAVARVEQPDDVRYVLFDLADSNTDLESDCGKAKQLFRRAKLIGYCPHVREDLLQTGAALLDAVEPRSKFIAFFESELRGLTEAS